MDKPKAKRNIEYPAETRGSRAAAINRQEVDKLSEEEIQAMYEAAMKIAYGGAGKQKVGSRH